MDGFSIWHVLLIAVVLYLLRPLISGFRQEVSEGSSHRGSSHGVPVAGSIAYEWPSLDEYEFEVVGESHYQDVLRHLAGEHGTSSANAQHRAILIPYDNNRYDDKAVAVAINGQLVGHLSREDARSFRRRLGQKGLSGQSTSCGALVVGGWVDRAGEKKSYGVKLDIKPFE